MKDPDSNLRPSATTQATLVETLLNVLVAPGEAFDAVLGEVPRRETWLVPTMLVCMIGLLIRPAARPGESGGEFVVALALCLIPFVGVWWSALVLWWIGRVVLKSPFTYRKSLDVAGLTGMVVVLGMVVTHLLAAAATNPSARPSLSFLVDGSGDRLRSVLDLFDVFYIWTMAVLAIGLSRLTGLSCRESASWVFGYWLLARGALVVLT